MCVRDLKSRGWERREGERGRESRQWERESEKESKGWERGERECRGWERGESRKRERVGDWRESREDGE